MNTPLSSTTKTTPYKVVFGQHPRSSIALIEISHIQACQKNKNVCGDIPLLKSICNCASKFNTLRCSCRKANLQCSTKCHTNVIQTIVNVKISKNVSFVNIL